jgi:hypothetical protein
MFCLDAFTRCLVLFFAHVTLRDPAVAMRTSCREQVLEATDVVLLLQGPLAKAKQSGLTE